MRKLVLSLALVTLITSSVHAATPPKTTTTPATSPAKPTGPEPGHPIPFIGNSFLVYGGNAVKWGTFDLQAKKEISSLALSPPWNATGVSLCGSDYDVSHDGKNLKCFNTNKDGGFTASADSIVEGNLTVKSVTTTDRVDVKTALKIPSGTFAQLGKTLPADQVGDIFLCTDCVVNTTTYVHHWFRKDTEMVLAHEGPVVVVSLGQGKFSTLGNQPVVFPK